MKIGKNVQVEILKTRVSPNAFHGTMSECLHFGRAMVLPLSLCHETLGSGVSPQPPNNGSAVGRRASAVRGRRPAGASGAGPLSRALALSSGRLVLCLALGDKASSSRPGPVAHGLDKPVKLAP